MGSGVTVLTELALPPAVDAERTVSAALAGLRAGERRGVVVDSPPAAGKSTFVVRAAVDLSAPGEALMVIAQTNEQVDDVFDRLAEGRGATRPNRCKPRPPKWGTSTSQSNAPVVHARRGGSFD